MTASLGFSGWPAVIYAAAHIYTLYWLARYSRKGGGR